MRNSKLLSVLLVLVLTCCMLFAIAPLQTSAAETSGTCGEGVTWSYDDATGTLTISGNGAMEDYTQDHAPWEPHADTMTNVVVEEGVTHIGNHAFNYYERDQILQQVILPEGLISIGNYAFAYHCFTTIELPSTLTSIGSNAFYLTSLEEITIPANISSIGSNAFRKCTQLTNVVFEEGCALVGTNMFNECSSLKTVELSSSVQTIGQSAFRKCTSLSSVTIPDGVETIEDGAFNMCSGLESIFISESVQNLAMTTFNGCNALQDVYCVATEKPDGWDEYWQSYLPDTATVHWGYNPGIEYEYTISYGKVTITGYHGEGGHVVIPSEIEGFPVCAIGMNGFDTCLTLTSVEIPASVTDINVSAFRYCSSLNSISVAKDNSVYYSQNDCLINKETGELVVGCNNSVIPEGVKSIASYAFSGRSLIGEVIFPESLTYIGYRTFYGCTSLSFTNIPGSVSFIGESAFYGCNSLVNVELSEGLNQIQVTAFEKCISLKSVIVPASVKLMGASVFYDCDALTDIYCGKEAFPDTGWSEAWLRNCTATVHWGYVSKGKDLEFTSASLTLYESLTINFKVDAALFGEGGYENPYVKFVLDGAETVVSAYKVQNGLYVFDYANIRPDQMTDKITATLYATYEGELISGETKEYSVAMYCESVLNAYATDEYADLRTLIVDMLNYGAATQAYTGRNIEKLANAFLSEAQKAWGSTNIREVASHKNLKHEVIDNPTVSFVSAGLNLKESIAVRLSIDAQSVDGMSVKITCGELSWTEKSFYKDSETGRYMLYVKLNASRMSDPIIATVYQNGAAVSNSLCYSIESYAKDCADGETTAELQALLDAMIKYGDAANAYVN